MFAVQKRPTTSFGYDSGAMFFDTSVAGASSLQQYQFRLGGRYYPAAPVQCSAVGSAISNGGAEAYVELAKALNILGDYRLSTSCNITNWAVSPLQAYTIVGGALNAGVLPEFDYSLSLAAIVPGSVPQAQIVEYHSSTSTVYNNFCGKLASGCFGMAISLETSNGLEISGLNGEEQSDFQLIAQWTGQQVLGTTNSPSTIEVYSFYDAMLILKENNTIELIQ